MAVYVDFQRRVASRRYPDSWPPAAKRIHAAAMRMIGEIRRLGLPSSVEHDLVRGAAELGADALVQLGWPFSA